MNPSTRAGAALAAGAALLVPLTLTSAASAATPSAAAAVAVADRVLPTPVSLVQQGGPAYVLGQDTAIYTGSSAEAAQVGAWLAGLLRPSTGYQLPVKPASGAGKTGGIRLVVGGPASLGSEGYTLDTARDGVVVTARTGAGLFHGVQTLRQLMPAGIERRDLQATTVTVPAVSVTDSPRFGTRGATLDVSRHFQTVAAVEEYVDDIALHKMNTLVLHLSDDQGWRLFINSWPRLATYGGSTEVGGTPGGYYTQQEYADIVRYAASRYITIVPEFDMPGHTNAAQASYAQLNCDKKAPPLYTGIDVGFSSFCVPDPVTYHFLDQVIGEIAALTPGPYISIGGDEAHSTSAADYVTFVDKVQAIIEAHGKKLWGWHQTAAADVHAGDVAAYWGTGGSEDVALAQQAVAQGEKLVLAPADHAYMDMQYGPNSPYGLHWAGYVGIRDSYSWDPATLIPGVGEKDVSGVIGALWSETLPDIDAIQYMAFPRISGLAELGWSPRSSTTWSSYRDRLAAQAPRWTAMGIDFYRSPWIDWRS